MLRVLATERLSWALSAFYFLTFGGFVAFSIYLPSLLRDEFNLTMTDAGFRTAGFVVLACLLGFLWPEPVGEVVRVAAIQTQATDLETLEKGANLGAWTSPI